MQMMHIARSSWQMDRGEIRPLTEARDRLSDLDDADISSIGNIDLTSDESITACGKCQTTDSLSHIGEVSAVLAGTENYRRQAIENANHETRDDFCQITAIMLARAVAI